MKSEPCEVNIGISIIQVKKKDAAVQDVVGLTMIDGKKNEFAIPFSQDIKYKFDSLMKNFSFKYAILQNEEIMGILYLEVPFKYKFSKKFKIDDWFPLKPFDRLSSTDFDASLVARVMISYDSNVKLDPKDATHIEDLKETTGSPKSSFKDKMRKIKKASEVSDKENLNYLEQVERNILSRRRKGDASAEKNLESHRLLRSSSKMKGALSRQNSNKQSRLPNGATPNPEQFYKTAGTDAKATDEALLNRMSGELAKSRQEIKELREKLKALENGQMTVDNAELAKKLDEEQKQLNAERLQVLKDLAKQGEENEKEKKRLEAEKSKSEEDHLRKKTELDERLKQLELDRLQYKAKDDDLRARANDTEDRESRCRDLEKALADKDLEMRKTEESLAEYQLELNELKDKLLKEREKLITDKSQAAAEKDELERDIKSLKSVRDNLQKEKDKEMKDINKKKKDLESLEEKLQRDGERQALEDERLKRDKLRLEEELRRQKALTEELEDEKLKLWKDRNQLNNEVKQFIDDKKKMENDLKWKNREVEQVDEEIRREMEELERDREGLEEYEQKLEALKEDLETRERMLLHEREDFNNLKLKFIDGLMQSGGLAYLTPELKQMAKNMGIDVDQMEDEKNRLEGRRKELEKLQRQHEEELLAIKAKVNSRNASRRSSVSRGAGSVAGSTRPGAPRLGNSNKLVAQGFLADLYEEASNKFALKEMRENKEKVDRLTEEKVFTQNLIEQLKAENRQIKKDYELMAKIIEQYRGDGLKIDLNSLLGRSKPKDVGTSTDAELGFDEDRFLMEDRIRELEGKVKRGGSVAGHTVSDVDDDDFNARLREIQEQLKKLLIQIDEEQREFTRKGMPEIGNRIKRIHYLVYSFIQDIIQFLIRFHRPKDRVQKEMFTKILNGLNIDKPEGMPAARQPAQGDINSRAAELNQDLQDLIKKLQDKNSDLENKNSLLRDLLESMKSTFEFFELVNDQYIMQRS